MGMMHSGLDVYRGDDLVWPSEDVRVITDKHRSTVTIKARDGGKPGFPTVLVLREVVTERSTAGYRFTGLDSDDNEVILTALQRAPRCCGRR